MKVLSVTKYLSYAFLGLVGIVTIIVLLALSPLGINVLVNVANNQEGVVIEDVSGSLYSQINIGKVRFNNPQMNIALDAAKLEIGLSCIFSGQACIDLIGANKLEIVLLENNQPSPASEPLTDYIELPIRAYLNKLSFAEISVFTQAIDAKKVRLTKLTKVNAKAFMYKNFVLNELSIKDATVFLAGETQTASNLTKSAAKSPTTAPASDKAEHWIHTLKNAKYTPITLPEIFVPINAEIQKFTVDYFCLQSGDNKAQATCTQQTSLNASVKKQKINATFESKPIEQIASNLSLKASIDLADTFTHDVSLRLLPNAAFSSKQAQAIVIELKGNANETGLVINSARFRENILRLQAKIDIAQNNLPLGVELSASGFSPVINAWMPAVEVPVSQFTASIKGDTQRYEFDAVANIDSEQASDVSLSGMVSLSDKYVNVSELKTSGDIGELNANFIAKLTQFTGTDGVSIDSDIGFNKLQLKPLVPQMDSELNGDIKLNASITPSQLWGGLKCQKVKGVLQGYDVSLQCDVTISKAGLVKVNSLAFNQGSNKITGKGQFELPKGLSTSQLSANENTNTQWASETKTAVDFDVNLADLSTLYADASGAILGKIDVKGQIDKPLINAKLTLEKLDVADIGIQQAQLDIAINAAKEWESDISLVSQEIWLESMLAKQVNATLKGNLSSHKLSLSLEHPEYSLNHEFSGKATISENDWRWSGSWDKGEFGSAFDTFTLNKPSNIRISQTSASIRPHCWVSTQLGAKTQAESSALDAKNAAAFSSNGNKVLCIEQLQYSPELTEVSAKLAYNLSVPLLHYFPDVVQQGTSLPFSTDVELSYSQARGIEVDAYTLMTQANIVSSKHNIELVAVVANSSLKNQVLKTNVFAGTKSTGAIGLNSNLNLDPKNRTHKGQLSISNFLLSPLQRFIPHVEKLSGAIAGNILYDGPLLEPNLNGELIISDVELVADNYPYPVTNFNQTITVSNKKADIEGEFELGSGAADYSGTLTLFDEDKPFSFTGEIDGAGMQLVYAGNELLASPSLKIALDPGNFSLKGEVTIPNAQIKIDKLPESAKSPSSDTIIIGKAPEPPALPIGLDIDVRILIDPPKLKRVTINALDLKASLAGDLQVQVKQKQNPDTKEFSPLETYVYGSVNVLTGSYEAYGQNLQIQKGAIFFSGAPSLPQFGITAVRNPLNTADNVVAGIRISGNPVVPKVELFSEPTMIQARQLSYLLQGTDLKGGEGQSQDVMLVNMLVNFGVGNSENGVNRFGKSLGFDSLNLQTAGQGINTQVQLTGRISDDIQVIYGVGLFDQATQVILRYQLLPQMFLEAKSGTTSAVDLFYEWTTKE